MPCDLFAFEVVLSCVCMNCDLCGGSQFLRLFYHVCACLVICGTGSQFLRLFYQ